MNFGIEGLHYRALPLASKAVEGLPKIQEKHDGVCKGCVKGKNTKKTFPSSESKEKRILEIIHSNVCGPMSSSSLSDKFKEFKALIENHTEKKIKTIRSDNGGEFTSNEFK